MEHGPGHGWNSNEHGAPHPDEEEPDDWDPEPEGEMWGHPGRGKKTNAFLRLMYWPVTVVLLAVGIYWLAKSPPQSAAVDGCGALAFLMSLLLVVGKVLAKVVERE